MTDFDPNKYLTTRVHGGVREIVGEEAEKIRERVRERMMTDIVEKLRSSIGLYTTEAVDKQLHNEAADEIERLRSELLLVEAERDGLASLLDNVRDDYLRERRLVSVITESILDHLDASLKYNRN